MSRRALLLCVVCVAALIPCACKATFNATLDLSLGQSSTGTAIDGATVCDASRFDLPQGVASLQLWDTKLGLIADRNNLAIRLADFQTGEVITLAADHYTFCMADANVWTGGGGVLKAHLRQGCVYARDGVAYDDCEATCRATHGTPAGCCKCDATCHACPCRYCENWCQKRTGSPTAGWAVGTPEFIVRGGKSANDAFYTTTNPDAIQRIQIDTGLVTTLAALPFAPQGIERFSNATAGWCLLVVDPSSKSIVSYNQTDGTQTGFVLQHASFDSLLGMEANGTHLAIADSSGKVFIVDVAQKAVLQEIAVPGAQDVSWTPNSRFIAVATSNDTNPLVFIDCSTWFVVGLTSAIVPEARGVASLSNTKFAVTTNTGVDVVDVNGLCPICVAQAAFDALTEQEQQMFKTVTLQAITETTPAKLSRWCFARNNVMCN